MSQVCYRTIAGLCGAFLFSLAPSVGAQTMPLQVTQVVRGSTASGDEVVIVNWTGGTPPFQVHSLSGFGGSWQDVDGATSASSQTNILTSPTAFYRVVGASSGPILSAKPTDTKAPTVPVGLTAAATSCSQINLAWNASTDLGSPASGVKGYNVYRNGVFLLQVLAPATATSDTAGLVASKAYSYAVSALDNKGNQSAKSASVSATTPACVDLICTYTISSNAAAFTPVGGAGSFAVTTKPNCAWTATPNQTWLHTTSSGTGNGTATYTVDANPDTTTRTGTITAGGQTFTVSQTGVTCAYSLSVSSAAHGPGTESGGFGVTATPGCSWSATTAQAWIHTTSTGTGTGTVAYTVDANTGASARTGTISIGGQNFAVNQAAVDTTPPGVTFLAPLSGATLSGQVSVSTRATDNAGMASAAFYYDGAGQWTLIGSNSAAGTACTNVATLDTAGISDGSHTLLCMAYDTSGNSSYAMLGVSIANSTCNYSFNPTGASHGAGAESGSFAVTATVGCAWSAGTPQAWIHTTSSSSGNGTASYTVDANTGTTARSGSISAGGQTFTVNQAGITCAYTLSASSGSHGSAAASGSFGVTATAGCAWSASTVQTWIHTTSTGSGSGTVNYTVDANTSTNSRSGSITVGGQAFTVNQSGITCTYSLNTTSASHGSGSESGSFGVTATAGCSWSAGTVQTWIHTTSTGSGSGTVNYTVDANTSTNSRSGSITVGGQAFTVNQSGITCTYSLNTTSASHGSGSESGSFGVTATAGCSWSAGTVQTWIHTTSAGSGNGTVNYTVDANTSTNSRSSSITVGGQTCTVNQSGITCTYSVNTTSASHGSGAESGSFGVTATAGCAWSASTAQTWIHTTSTGSGNGTVSYTVDVNTSTNSRTGTITAGGQPFTVNQAGVTCTYSLNTTSASVGSAATSGSFGVTATAGCAWSASTAQAWLHTTSAGSGNGTVSYTVDANTSTTARSGSITVSGQTFTVNQAGITCTFTLNTTSASHGAGAESGSFGVTATAGCAWSASTAQAWLHTTSAGSGNGTVSYTVDANTSTTARSGSITVSGQTFTVNQAGITCTYTLSASSASYGSAATSGSYTVTTLAGCSWSATTVQTWLHTTSSGSGNGTVSYTVDANTSTAARSGTITVGGQTFTVNQSGVVTCTYSLNTTSASHGSAAGSGSFGVTAAAGCAWSATTAQTWLHTTSSGSGNGTVNYTVDANTGTSARSGSITVAGQIFSISQSAGGVDTTPPVVTFLTPLQGSGIGGQAQLTVRVTDNVSVAHADFYYDSAGQWLLIGTNNSSGTVTTNSVLFDTTLAANGAHTILCQAFDAAGNGSYATVGISITNILTDPGNSFWLKEIVRPGTGGEATGIAVKTDSQGNVFVAGNFKGVVNFSTIAKTNLGGSDVFLAKFSSNGIVQWVQTYGGVSDDAVTSLTLDGAGNLAITGTFFGTANFGGANLTALHGIFGADIFVAKYNSAGAPLWSKSMGGQYGNNFGQGIAADAAGNLFVVGHVYAEANLGNGIFTTRALSADAFLLKLNGTNGAYLWSRTFGSTDSDECKGVVVDANGDVIVCGYGYAAMDIGGVTNASIGGADLFIAKFGGATGNFLWSKVGGGTSPDTAEGVAVDANRNIYLTGLINFAATIGTATLNSPYGTAAYIVKFDPAGNTIWARSWGYDGSGGSMSVGKVVADSNGNVAIGGTASGVVDFGSGSLTAGSANFFVAKYDPTGRYLWAKRSSNTSWTAGYGICTDGDRDIYATGLMFGDVTMDGFTASSPGTQSKSAFLYKVSP